MYTTIYLCNRQVQALVGSPGRRPKIRLARQLTLREGSLINGVIVDEEALSAELKGLLAGLPQKGLRLVLDSGQLLTRSLQLPPMRANETLAMAQKEFAAAGREGDVVDYMAFAPRKGETMAHVLCCAAQADFVTRYVSLFEGMGVKLGGVTIALAAHLRLVDGLPFFQDKTCVLLSFDGDTMLAVLLEDGRYKYATRARLLGEGPQAVADEVARTVSGIVQFQASEKSAYQISAAYFGGCGAECLSACAPGIRSLGMEADWFPESNRFRFVDGSLLRDCLFTAGEYLVR